MEDQLAELDSLLLTSIAEVELDSDAARREVVDNSCVGPGGTGKNVRFYFDEPSHDRAVDTLRALESYWSSAEGVEINDALQDDGSLASLLAVSGDLGLEGWWFPASEELAIGGSTTCVHAAVVSTTTSTTDLPSTDEPGSTSTTAS